MDDPNDDEWSEWARSELVPPFGGILIAALVGLGLLVLIGWAASII